MKNQCGVGIIISATIALAVAAKAIKATYGSAVAPIGSSSTASVSFTLVVFATLALWSFLVMVGVQQAWLCVTQRQQKQ